MKHSHRIDRLFELVKQKARRLYDGGPVLGSKPEPLAKFGGRHGPVEEWG